MAKNKTQYANGYDGNSRATPYSPRDARRIQSQLRRPLGPEFVRSRTGAGNARLSYIEGNVIMNIANHIFGADGWSSSIQSFVVDFEKESADGRWSVGGSCLVRITLRNGTYKEDIGYGMIENVKSLGMAYEKIKKEAVTDAIKRAMRQFGNALGNCVYDKEYIRTVSHISKQPRNRLQGEDLFRYSDLVGEANCANMQGDDGNSGASTSAAGSSGSLAEVVTGGGQSHTAAHDMKDMSDDHGSDSVDFDMDDFGEDAFEGLGLLESNRPVIPETHSGNYYAGQALPNNSYGTNQPVQNTPVRGAATGPGWRPSSAPGLIGGGVRPGASPGGQRVPEHAQGPPSAARSLFCLPPHPPQPAILAQHSASTTPSLRRPSFAEVSGFMPSPQVTSVLGNHLQSANKNAPAPNGDLPTS
ncbi:DNA repair protein rad52 [Coemansia sp. BCRC 34301]|nr:DNA repair protein rad52 [Coemansia sp. BCRC 34301]